MEPGWRNQDEEHWTIPWLIGMDCARLHVENFATPPLISLFCFPFSLLIKTSACPEMEQWALRQEFPIFQVIGTWNKTTFLNINPCLSSIGFQSGQRLDLCLVTVALVLCRHFEHIKLTFVSELLHFLISLRGMQFPKMFLSLAALFTQISVDYL